MIEPEVGSKTASEYHRHSRGRLCNSYTPKIRDMGQLFVNCFRMLGKAGNRSGKLEKKNSESLWKEIPIFGVIFHCFSVETVMNKRRKEKKEFPLRKKIMPTKKNSFVDFPPPHCFVQYGEACQKCAAHKEPLQHEQCHKIGQEGGPWSSIFETTGAENGRYQSGCVWLFCDLITSLESFKIP